MLTTDVAAVEDDVGQGRVHRVLAAVAHPKTLQRAPPTFGTLLLVAAAHLLFVRFFQVIKALSSTVGGAGRRTERRPGAPHGGGTRALQVGRAGRLQVARRQPGVDDLERRGCRGGCGCSGVGSGSGGDERRQSGHQEQRQRQRQARVRGPGHSAGQGAVAAR